MSEEQKKENKNKWVIDKQTAEEEFARFCEAWEIDDDVDEMKEEDREDFNGLKNKVTTAIKRGRLIFNSDDTFEYKVSKHSKDKEGDKLTISPPKGEAFMETDRHKEKELMKKSFSFLANMTGKSVPYFHNLNAIDIRPIQAIMTLSLAG